MLDVIAGAMGTFLIIMVILLPYYKNDEIIQELRQKLLTTETEQTRLQEEKTNLQEQLEGCQSENDQNATENEKLTQLLEQCRGTNQELAGGKTELADQLQACQEARVEINVEKEKLADQLQTCQDTNEQLTDEKTQSTEQMNQYQETIVQLEQEKLELQEEVRKLGFTLKEKNVVFVVDISGSMQDANKIHNVTTGIKMQIATMDETYTTDVVFFPNKLNDSCLSEVHSDYGCMWDGLKQVTIGRKYEAYRFLSDLRAAGSTPTENVLNFVLEHYTDAGAIILFSDGAPAVGDQELPWTDLEGILERVTAKNNGQKKINTIGVGPEFREEHSTTDKVRFLQMLAQRNGGFYSGF